MKERPILVFVPGMFCHAGVFNRLVQYLGSKGWPCLALTLPYHDVAKPYKPDPRLAQMGINEYVQFVQEQLAQLDRAYILIGHSMGGLISLKATGLVDVNPKLLILLSPAVPCPIVAFRASVIKSFQPILSTWKWWQKVITMGYEDIEYSMLNKVPEDQRQAIYNTLVYESGRAAKQMGFWFFGDLTTRVNYPGINCPVVIFIGEDDNITPHDVVSKLAKKLRKKTNQPITFVPLPELGHWLLTEMDFAQLEQLLEQLLHEQL